MSKKKTIKPKKKKRLVKLRFLTVVMLIVIFITGGIDGYCIYNVFGKGVDFRNSNYDNMTPEQIEIQKLREDSKKKKTSGEISYASIMYEKNIDNVIVDESDAYDVLLSVQSDLGIYNAKEEYSCSYMRSNDYYDVYTMQQYYNGIEIYGSELKMTADKSGNLLSVNGVHKQLEGFDTSVSLSESDACNQVEKYLKSEYQVTTDDVSINEMGKKIFFDENDEPVVGYLFEIISTYTIEDDYIDISLITLKVNGNTKSISADINFSGINKMKNKKVEGQNGERELDVFELESGENLLKDEYRNLVVFDRWISKNEKEAAIANTDNKVGVDFLANIQKAYDFYDELFDRHCGTFLLYIDEMALDHLGMIEYYIGTNAFTNRNKDNNGDRRISLTKSNYADCLDVMAHEYTHAMLPLNVKENTSFNEGLSDIFGELIEDYYDGGFNNSCNWKLAELRDFANPAQTKNATSINDTNGEYYHDSTLISHSAYLMTQGINGTEPLTTEQLANLYYYMIPNMTASTDFKNFRWLVELQAYIMNIKGELSDSQVESVIDAFDRVGIERNYNYSMTPGGIMTIYDFNGECYSECTVTISKNGNDLYTVEPDRNGEIELRSSLKKGIYRALVEDKNSDLSRSFYFVINDNSAGQTSENYASEVKIPTSFTSPEKEVVLALDVSGSMEGTPLSETKSAALQFTDTIFDINPNTKINLITYSEYAVSAVSSSNDKNEICNAIRNLQSDGGTNMYDAVSYAKSVLDEISTENKYLLIMSDGLPNRGEKIDGNYNAPIYNLTGEMKSDNITICSLGFFHNLDENELSEGTDFMNHIASEGYYYDARDISEIQNVFNDIAKQVGGQTSSIIRVACPVDVTVRYNGETLSSAEDNLNTRTSFGTLTFEGEENEIKMLRLNEEADYEICINGTGTGKMDYSISFADKNGDYTDTRTFENIPINTDTVISTNSKKSGSTMLNIDTDGDGKFDLNYIAGKNKNSKEFYKVVFIYIAVITGILLFILLAIEIMLIVKHYRINKYCSECGSIINRNSQFCTECGNAIKRVPLILPEKIERKPQHRAVKIIKLSVTGICLAMTIGIISIYRSAPNTVFLQLRNSEFISAEMLYNNSIEDSWFGKRYLSFVTDIYLNKVQNAYKNNIVDENFAVSVYNTIANMDMGKASDNAEEYLLDME